MGRMPASTDLEDDGIAGDVEDRPTAVYRLYDAAGQLLYVGVSCELEKRWATHRRGKSWWPAVAEKQIVWHPNRVSALLEESAAIEDEGPAHNFTGVVDEVDLRLAKVAKALTEPRPNPASGPRGYRDLAALICSWIDDGTVQPGAVLPSERSMQQTYGLGRDAVRDAIFALRVAGLIDVRHGYGAVVRVAQLKEDLAPPLGSTIEVRMPAPGECDWIGEGVPVFVVVAPDGTGELFPGDRHRLVWPVT